MQKKLCALIVLVGGVLLTVSSALAVVIIPPTPKITLTWNYPSQQMGTNLIFKIYHTANIAMGMTKWEVLTNVIGTNLSTSIPIKDGPHFFALTALNAAGESDFATVTP